MPSSIVPQEEEEMAQSSRLVILDSTTVSPPADSVPATTLPLISFFDVPWFSSPPMHSLFFYEFPYPTLHFTQTTLPILKHSLSLTLQHFFPLSGNLLCPLQPNKPFIQYRGGDSVAFTFAESTAADFNRLKSNSPQDVKLAQPFVPQLPPARVLSYGTRVFPIMALQVTVFPNSGICIGATHRHVAADGISFMHFMRSWASVCKAGGDSTCLDESLPSHNREVIKDPCGCDSAFLKEYWNWTSSWREDPGPIQDAQVANMVRATFRLTRAQIDRLKLWATTQSKNDTGSEQLHVSTFVVASAFMWVCLIKSQDRKSSNVDEDRLCYFIFAVDCRNRIEFPVDETYFGNCIAPGVVQAKKSELIREDGVLMAAKAIGREVREMESEGLRGADGWMSKLWEAVTSGNHVDISGSPKMRIYSVDFGWGKPANVEFLHIDAGRILALSESGDGKGGIDVALALNKDQMDALTANFEKNLKLFI